ncbi:MAG: hypothetical protein HOL37_02050 [Rhodospirillaceae bacterium]|jgi:7-cyano-7-deazaguanine reductase|nr:hypothetical protein [Rhodospirillaceae bacterium]MBT4218812.1 hypothetical protein [Rhodospirillaceae bacterium]MBT4463795.1 hypothetical protein [Rhodospirillaceae bacterium]MBT5013419.1 hypothetical protein [Rhodospirillaceae bacterium]MBT5308094.1 hypothetical protein [Rhodospirillaceae bacterium]
MDVSERRKHLPTTRNPDGKLDYVTTLVGHMAAVSDMERSSVTLRYVPDKLILEPAAFGKYLDVLGTVEWPTLEEAAAVILNDINNELIARWVQVSIDTPDQVHPGIASHEVLLEDQQPKWSNPELLSRLK